MALGDSTWHEMHGEQTLGALTTDGKRRNFLLKAICTPCGSIVKPSLTRRPAYELLIDELAKEPGNRPVRVFEFPMWGGHRLGHDSSGLEMYRECRERVMNRDPECRLAFLEQVFRTQKNLTEKDCWLDQIHPTRVFATWLVQFAMNKCPWASAEDEALLIVVADGWNYRQPDYYDFRQSLLLCTTIDEIRNLLPAFTKIHSEKRLTKKFQKSTMDVMVSETIKELGRKLKISVSPLAPPGVKPPAEAMKEDPNQLNPWHNVVQTERMAGSVT